MKGYLRFVAVELVVVLLFMLFGCDEMPSDSYSTGAPPTIPANIQTDMRAINANATSQAEYQKMQSAKSAATNTAVALARQATEVSIQAAQTASVSQARATEAANNALAIGARATANANATAESLRVEATRTWLNQQAIIAQQLAAASATANAQNAAATGTRQVAQVTEQAAYLYGSQTQTAYDRHATEMARAQNTTATSVSASATATSVALSASGTQTAQSVNAESTQVAAAATATMVREGVLTEQNKADWDRKMEAARVMAVFIALVAAAIIIGFAAIRLLDAVILRIRVIKDPVRGVAIVTERDRQGRQQMIFPGRSPGPVINMVPDNTMAGGYRIEMPGADRDTTSRDQAVSLMLAARAGAGGDELLDDLLGNDRTVAPLDEDGEIKLIPPDTQKLLEVRWKENGGVK